MKYLITGGAGFVGSHLAETLLEQGHRVAIIDDLSTGSVDNIDHLKRHKRFHYTIDSVFNEPVTAELVDAADIVFHLAAAVGVMLIVESPVRTIETNIGGTEIVLKHAAKKRKPVVIASTSEVYGKSTKVPYREDDDLVLGATVKGRWSYACSKAIDEFLALSYWKERKLPTIIVRLFNTVGPRQTGRYGMVIPRFVTQALDGKPLTVFGTGRQSRCFAHVADVVACMARLSCLSRAYGKVFNIGSDREISINDLARLVIAKINRRLTVKRIPYAKAYEEGFEDMMRRVPDLSRIKAMTGYAPQYDIDRIIDDVIAYYRDKRSATTMRPSTRP